MTWLCHRFQVMLTCYGFLTIEFDLRGPSKQELGTAAWRQRNSRYVYHVTLGRVGDFDRGELEDAWRGIRERLDRREGTLHGYFARGSTCFYLKKTDRGVERSDLQRFSGMDPLPIGPV